MIYKRSAGLANPALLNHFTVCYFSNIALEVRTVVFIRCIGLLVNLPIHRLNNNMGKYDTKGTPEYTWACWRSRQRQTKRKVEFTFNSWYDKWIKSGKWDQRGIQSHEYCLSLIDTDGPHSPDNTEIITNDQARRKPTK